MASGRYSAEAAGMEVTLCWSVFMQPPSLVYGTFIASNNLNMPLEGDICGATVTDSLSMMLRLLGEESAEASWLIQARSRMDPVEPCDEEW